MKKIVVVSLFLLSCILPVENVQAVGLSLTTAQQVYKPGDTILVTADIYNDYDSEVDVVLECLLTSRTNISPDRLVSCLVTLDPGELKTIILYKIYVAEDFPSDEYTAVARLILDNTVYEEQEITFVVEDTLKRMDFEVHLCKDRECEDESRVFIQSDTIYMSYESSIDGIHVAGTVSLPDGSTEHIVLPTELHVTQTGSYALLVTASKDGYTQDTKKINFAVIGKPRASILTGISSTFNLYHDVVELHIRVVKEAYSNNIYGIEILQDLQQPIWDNVEAIEAPEGWSFEKIGNGVKFYTETNPLLMCQRTKFVFRVKATKISWFIKIHVIGHVHQNIGMMVSTRQWLYRYYFV